jgi:hypothetical protein
MKSNRDENVAELLHAVFRAAVSAAVGRADELLGLSKAQWDASARGHTPASPPVLVESWPSWRSGAVRTEARKGPKPFAQPWNPAPVGAWSADSTIDWDSHGPGPRSVPCRSSRFGDGALAKGSH